MVAAALFEAAAAHYQREYDEETEFRFAARRKIDAITNTRVSKRTATQGEKRLQRLEYILEHGFEWQRFAFDKRLHEMMVKASAELVVGEDWATVGPEIMRSRGWLKENTSKLVCAKAPRRFGKSVALSKFLAALCEVLLTDGGALKMGEIFTMSVFSTGLRASSGIKRYVIKFLIERGMLEHIVTNREQICELSANPHDPTAPKIQINFLPSKSEAYVLFDILAVVLVVLVVVSTCHLATCLFFDAAVVVGGLEVSIFNREENRIQLVHAAAPRKMNMDAVTEFAGELFAHVSHLIGLMNQTLCFSFFGSPCYARYLDSPMSYTCLAPGYEDTFLAAGGRLCIDERPPLTTESLKEGFRLMGNDAEDFTRTKLEMVLPVTAHVHLTHNVCMAVFWALVILFWCLAYRVVGFLERDRERRQNEQLERRRREIEQQVRERERVAKEQHIEFVRAGIEYWRHGRAGPSDKGDVKIIYDSREWVSVSGLPWSRLHPEIKELLKEANLVYAKLPEVYCSRNYNSPELEELTYTSNWHVGAPITNSAKSARKR